MTRSKKKPRGRDLDRRHRRMALIGAVIMILGVLAIFIKPNPFASGFTIRAVFSSAAQLHNGGEVRTAGIEIGQVTGISAGPHDSALVTMTINQSGLPIHSDATLTIKPRLVLEGNAYIDLSPGTPAAPNLRSGALVPERQTATSVQIDQLLDTFNMPTRDALQSSVAALATGLGAPGARAAGSANAPGWTGLRAAVRQFNSALPPVTTVAQAVQGTQPGDLGRMISSTADVTAQLAASPAALSDAVTSYNTTFAALAAQDGALASSISGFDTLLRTAPTPLVDLNRALPEVTTLGNRLLPTLHAIPNSLTHANTLLDQISDLVSPGELPALLHRLSPITSAMPQLESRLQTLFNYSTPVTDCIVTHVVPTLDSKIEDGVNTSGDPVYLDLVHMFAGLAGFSSDVDGNGGTVRIGITTGDHIVDSIAPGLGQVVGLLPNVDGVRPTWLGYGVPPPFRPDEPCASQPLPDLNISTAAGPVPAWASSTQKPAASAAFRAAPASKSHGRHRAGASGKNAPGAGNTVTAPGSVGRTPTTKTGGSGTGSTTTPTTTSPTTTSPSATPQPAPLPGITNALGNILRKLL
jgi:phospholipid/cholesterol/gamma-HCH transport system substrate-binding protein